ncbi:MAG: hypothetical protein Q8K60_06580 [Parachlamydiaceae bacterium]|nr:hypothetical protein [Parachlamydiaceae bacterium]
MIHGFENTENFENIINVDLDKTNNEINKINVIYNNNIIIEEPVRKINFYSELPQEKNNIQDYVQLDRKLDHLTDQQKEKILDDCIGAYKESIQCFEQAIINVCNHHPDAKSFADELCNRLYTFMKAYHEILIETNQELTPFQKEIMTRLHALSEFATDGTGTGSVGFNPLAVEKVLENGTFREKMMLIYTGIYFLQRIDFNEEMVKKVNQILPNDFQLNTEVIAKDREQGKGFIVKNQNVLDFRNNDGRLLKDSSEPQEDRLHIKDVENLTVREMRAMLQDYVSPKDFNELKYANQSKFSNKKVSWIRGKDLFKLNPESDFVKKAIALGSIPLLTGPSGTADEYLQACDYFNMQNFKDKALVALVGWMGSGGDHSVHEIRVAASWHGIEYPEGPKAFENFYSKDLMQQIENEMLKSNYHLPSFYLSFEFQNEMAKQFQ